MIIYVSYNDKIQGVSLILCSFNKLIITGSSLEPVNCQVGGSWFLTMVSGIKPD